MDVYSFKDVIGAFEHPVAGPFSFAGEIGEGSIEEGLGGGPGGKETAERCASR